MSIRVDYNEKDLSVVNMSKRLVWDLYSYLSTDEGAKFKSLFSSKEGLKGISFIGYPKNPKETNKYKLHSYKVSKLHLVKEGKDVILSSIKDLISRGYSFCSMDDLELEATQVFQSITSGQFSIKVTFSGNIEDCVVYSKYYSDLDKLRKETWTPVNEVLTDKNLFNCSTDEELMCFLTYRSQSGYITLYDCRTSLNSKVCISCCKEGFSNQFKSKKDSYFQLFYKFALSFSKIIKPYSFSCNGYDNFSIFADTALFDTKVIANLLDVYETVEELYSESIGEYSRNRGYVKLLDDINLFKICTSFIPNLYTSYKWSEVVKLPENVRNTLCVEDLYGCGSRDCYLFKIYMDDSDELSLKHFFGSEWYKVSSVDMQCLNSVVTKFINLVPYPIKEAYIVGKFSDTKSNAIYRICDDGEVILTIY